MKSDRIGQQLGNYRLLSLLGRGGFAEVYLGEHIYLKTPAAIKLLQTRVADKDDLENFIKEAQTVARLMHPHIVRVMDFGVDNEVPFLVMDYAPNGTLRQRHPRGTRLPLTTIIPYVKEIADALQYAHDDRLIHRDVKPENMLLGRRNEILLSDFGIALVAQSSRYQSTQDVIGTVAYMSPEQIQGKPRPASDQYSLGIVVYEWLTGDRPFHGSFTELCTQHMFASPAPLRDKVPSVPLYVEQVVNTALSKDPKQRFMSVKAFANALEQAVKTDKPVDVSARPVNIASSPGDPTRIVPPPQVPPTQYAAPMSPPPARSSNTPPINSNPQRSSTNYTLSVCPRCGNEWDASKSPCTRCGLVIRLPNLTGSTVRPSTGQPYQQPSTAGSQQKKVNGWRIGKRQVVAMLIGIAIFTGMSILGTFFVYSQNQPNAFTIIIGLLLLGITEATLLFSGVVFGPWVGFFTGEIGTFIGFYIVALGPYFRYYGVSWSGLGNESGYYFREYFQYGLWAVGLALALIAFIAGFAALRTDGHYNHVRKVAIAEGFSLLGILCIDILAILILSSIFHTLYLHGIDVLLYTLPGLVVLPIVLPIYSTVSSRKKRA